MLEPDQVKMRFISTPCFSPQFLSSTSIYNIKPKAMQTCWSSWHLLYILVNTNAYKPRSHIIQLPGQGILIIRPKKTHNIWCFDTYA